MLRIACRSDKELSCLLGNLLCELGPPCERCDDDGILLRGRAPTGEEATVRLLEDRVLEINGGEDLVAAILGRRCPHGR